MQKVLRKRVLRDLKENFFRYLALGLVIAMGVFLVVTIVGSGETLTKGTEKMAKETNLEDGEFAVAKPLSEEEKTKIIDMGIDIEEQFYYDHILEDKDESTIRLFKVRDRINKIRCISGKEPAGNNEIVVEKRYAYEHDLKVGDTFEIAGTQYKISGIGVVSDYDGPMKEIADTACNSKKFGLVFMTDEAYEAYKASGKTQISEVYLYSYKLGGGKSDMDLKKSIENLTMFLKQDDNPRIFATKKDKVTDIEVGIMAGIVLFILFSYVISVFVVHGIEKEGSIIGTLYSMGVTKKDLMKHYMTLPVVVTFLAGLTGALIASTGLMVPMIAESSYSYFSIANFDFSVPVYLWVYSIAVVPLIAVIVNSLVIRSKLNKTALSLIKNEVKHKGVKKVKLKGLNFVSTFRIRQMLLEMRSTIAVVMGMFLSLLIFMLGVNCYTLCTNIAKDYKKDTKYEYMYMLKRPVKEVPEKGAIAYAHSCKMNAKDYSFDVTILGIDKDNPYFDVTLSDSKMDVIISNSMAEKFGLKVGDEFVVTDDDREIKYAFAVKNIACYATSFYVFMDIDAMRDMMGKPEDYYNVIFADEKLNIDSESVYAITSKDDVVRGASVFTGLMMPMVYTVSIASIVIFCVVMYLMMKVMIDRSAYNISLIKVFGYRQKEVRKLYLDGNFYVIAVGALVVLPLSKMIINKLFPFMVANVACGLNLKTPPVFYVIIYAAILALYFVINALLVRRVNGFTPAEVLKNRE